ncbi:MAG: tRNA (N(6)-L-threonylcarbamoyladenosine(37)-C(2))-methylthiotransferase MtaB [Hyphomicrobiaceae bacterium]|nr:tRNA (N(6)-L-threonylcarbamoyladenosine(37)-C(2))-methylthiotransferase MtaB [Hyphomicrobiaceae bacterium]
MSAPEILTFGCRLNAYETEVMRDLGSRTGLQDAIIVNTCAVTGEAVRQARQAIRRARRANPDKKIVVTGCAAQLEPEMFAAMAEVDHVIGNAEKMKAETFAALATGDTEKVLVDDIQSVRETASHMIEGFGSRTRAYVQIQNGCDHRCTFCIIPYARGASRSVAAGEVVAQIRRLVESGTREVVLTGVDITAYGVDLPGDLTLGGLVRKILKLVPELDRLRLSSIDSIEADPALIRAIAEEERLMPHLHLSLQAGHDLTLKRMRRRHSRAQAIEFCDTVRGLRSDMVFGADLIAGFPTETEEMFEGTLSIIDACGLTYLHVFPYSAREGTPAARMPQVDGTSVKARAARLREKGEISLDRHMQAQVGSAQPILMENETRGRTPHFTPVDTAERAHPGSIVSARVTGLSGGALQGTLLQ